MDPLLFRARGLWEGLARVPVSFAPTGGVNVVVSPESGLCPADWVGVVALGEAAIVTVPTGSAAVIVRDALARLSVQAIVDGTSVREVLPVARALGPAALSYVSPEGSARWKLVRCWWSNCRPATRSCDGWRSRPATRTLRRLRWARSRRPSSWSVSMAR